MAAWRWFAAFAFSTLAALLAAGAFAGGSPAGLSLTAPATRAAVAPELQRLASAEPGRHVGVIVQLRAGTSLAAGRGLLADAGATGLRDVRLINAVAGRMSAGAAWRLSSLAGVRAISLDAPVRSTASSPSSSGLRSAYNESIGADKAWAKGFTGRGVGVAVIDTGIAGGLTDFQADAGGSRIVANAVVNPLAQGAGDGYGHGTHVAGLIGGNGALRPAGDPLQGAYAGVAPDANLIAIKADDGHGATTVLDVIDGLQFAVDFKDAYGIRVVNLSLRSTIAESYRTDPLDAAVEAAWFSGLVVVVAAGNEGAAADAVQYAPANDPYVITIGAVDDAGTKTTGDDALPAWSSRGVTQDGIAKPDVLAPGAHMVSTLAPGSEFAGLCPSCVVDGEYFKVGGTSMAAAVASGAAALVIQANPSWTPDQVKGALVKKSRPVHSPRPVVGPPDLVDKHDKHPTEAVTTTSTIEGGEIAVDKVLNGGTVDGANAGLQPSTLIDPATGGIDFTRASWSRASWSQAADVLRASWSRASWSRASWSRASWSATAESCADFERASWSRASWSSAEIEDARRECASVDTTRASWSRASWSRASWSTSFEK
jgi:serine protease AprX